MCIEGANFLVGELMQTRGLFKDIDEVDKVGREDERQRKTTKHNEIQRNSTKFNERTE